MRAVSAAAIAAAGAFAHGQYLQVNLISDGTIPAAHTDSNLVNAWGLAFSPTGPFWINAAETGLSLVYDRNGAPFPAGNPLIVSVPPATDPAPTGIVFSGGSGGGFMVSQVGSAASAPSVFIFVTENGVISGWNPTVDATHAIPMVDNVVPNSIYKGAALATLGSHTFLYATNFHEGTVDVFDTNWALVGHFTDPALPPGYTPFGIANVHGMLVVTFALADADRHDDVAGPGNGYVDVFTPEGVLARRLISRGPLNAPWGIAVAPHRFGIMHDTLLVGNFGDGRINAFDMRSGGFRGPLRQMRGHQPIEIDGLWALAFGNGHNAGDTNKLYFTAGPDDETHGLFGYIRFAGRGDDH